MVYSGEYGGCVKRTFSGDGKKWIAGAVLTPEDVMHWPLGNRTALSMEGKVDWFGPPVEAEQKAREAGRPARTRGTTKATPAKTAPAKPAAKATPSSTTRRRR